MAPTLPRRPAPDEYAPFYAGYVAQVGDDPVAHLEADGAAWAELLAAIPDARGTWRYGPDKWSIKEVVGHVIDTERVFTYRLLRLAREDATPLPGFDENAWVPHAGSDARPLPELAAELAAVRASTLALVRSLAPTALDFRGTASGLPVTARALLWMTAGHATHHRQVLRERYL